MIKIKRINYKLKIIQPNAIELVQGAGFHSMLQHIEYCGRTCYKSEDKITEDSCYRFVNMLREHAHGAMLEHGTVYLTIPLPHSIESTLDPILEDCKRMKAINNLSSNKYTKAVCYGLNYYITTNYRVIVENGWEDVMQEFQSECTECHLKRRTFKITCNRGVSHEFVRHRVFSFAQESQRYCNYSKDKYGKEITFIKPIWQNDLNMENLHDKEKYFYWEDMMKQAQATYFFLLNNDLTPQLARGVLPNDVKTELVMTGFESDWEHFFILRCANDAHPEAKYLADMIKEQF